MKHGNNVRLIGITGGVGSGKSAVMDILDRDYGAGIILADLVAHELMEPGQAVYEEVIREFGSDILTEAEPETAPNEESAALDGMKEERELPVKEKEIKLPIDRKKLGQIVFSDPARLARLNEISHRGVKKEILRRINKYMEKTCGEERLLIAVEAALLIGSGLEDELDSLWYVYVRDAERIRRLEQGRGYSGEYARSIINHQLSDAEFRKHCRTVIDNNGDLTETKSQIDRAIHELFANYDKGGSL